MKRSDFLQTEVTFGRQKCLLMYRSDFFLSRKNRSVFFDDFLTQKCLFPNFIFEMRLVRLLPHIKKKSKKKKRNNTLIY